jgi:hypothetical protein
MNAEWTEYSQNLISYTIVLQRFQRHFCCNWTIGPAEKFASLDRNFDDFCHFESIKLLVSNWKNECRMDWIQSKPYIIHNLKDTLTTKWKITHKQVADLPIKYTWNFAHLEIRTGLSENFRHTQLTETFLIFPHVTNIP